MEEDENPSLEGESSCWIRFYAFAALHSSSSVKTHTETTNHPPGTGVFRGGRRSGVLYTPLPPGYAPADALKLLSRETAVIMILFREPLTNCKCHLP